MAKVNTLFYSNYYLIFSLFKSKKLKKKFFVVVGFIKLARYKII